MFTVLSKPDNSNSPSFAHARNSILISQMCKAGENIKNPLMLHLHQYQPINCPKEKHKHLHLERGRGEVAYLFYYQNKQ